jgi:hypothetical protein
MASQPTPRPDKGTRFERYSFSVSERTENILKAIILLAAWLALGYGFWSYIRW